MKKILLFIFANYVLVSIAYSQDTWVRTQYIDSVWNIGIHNDCTTVGPWEMVVASNGNILALIQINRKHEVALVRIDSAGDVLSSTIVAVQGGISSESCLNLHPTIDNGCVYVKIHDNGGLFTFDINRLGTLGSWTKQYNVAGTNFNEFVYKVTQSSYNTTFIQFTDSLVELDASGNFIQNRFPFSSSANLMHLPDSDFILCDSSHIIKENFAGAIQWDIMAPGFNVNSANADFVYASDGAQVMKIETQTGNVLWTRPVLSTSLVQSSDLGFITISGDLFSKYDSSATPEWSKTFLLPHFGLKCLAEIAGKHYVTGGAWCNYELYYAVDTGYSPLLICMDSVGNSVADSTDYFYSGNANDNNILGYADDGVYVAAAMNSTGSSRDTLIRSTDIGLSVFATNWPGQFTSGLNYKYSDVDGNGTINSDDMTTLMLSHFTYGPIAADPHWYRQANTASSPDLKFVFENHMIYYTDTIVVDVIVGSSIIPSDSIYGLSFDLRLYNISSGVTPIESFYSIKPTALGDTSQNLYLHYYCSQCGFPNTSMTLCRNDHMNTLLEGDTIVKLYFILPPNTTIGNGMDQLIVNLNAINKDGYPIAFNVVTDTIYFSTWAGTDAISENNLKLFPNPANDKLNIVFDNDDQYEIRIIDNLGKVIHEVESAKISKSIDIRKLNSGVYFIIAESKLKILKNIFIVQH